jgi:hypothetical protein
MNRDRRASLLKRSFLSAAVIATTVLTWRWRRNRAIKAVHPGPSSGRGRAPVPSAVTRSPARAGVPSARRYHLQLLTPFAVFAAATVLFAVLAIKRTPDTALPPNISPVISSTSVSFGTRNIDEKFYWVAQAASLGRDFQAHSAEAFLAFNGPGTSRVRFTIDVSSSQPLEIRPQNESSMAELRPDKVSHSRRFVIIPGGWHLDGIRTRNLGSFGAGGPQEYDTSITGFVQGCPTLSQGYPAIASVICAPSFAVSWHGSPLYDTRGPYLRVAMPTLGPEALGKSTSRREFFPRTFSQIAFLTGASLDNYQPIGAQQPSVSASWWRWSSGNLLIPSALARSGIIDAADSSHFFSAGIIFGLACSAGVAALQSLLSALFAVKRRAAAREGAGGRPSGTADDLQALGP